MKLLNVNARTKSAEVREPRLKNNHHAQQGSHADASPDSSWK
jgi:hypothetical protein